MQKGFVFLLIIWNSSPFISGNATNHLLFSLGCQAVIPCQHHRRDSNSFTWFYKKGEQAKDEQAKGEQVKGEHISRIYFQDKTGIEVLELDFRSRMKVPNNGSLIINNFTEADQGLYWCEHCFQDNCLDKQTTIINVKKETLKETRKTFYVITGIGFTYACPGDFTNLKWTFEASDTTALRNSKRGPEPDFVTYNKSINIINVKGADAGKYTCWKSGCDGHKQKLLTINLCVLTVHSSEVSSVSCALMCDMEFSNIKANGTINVETDTRTISVPVDPNGSLNCSAKQMFYGHTTVNSTHEPSIALNNSTDLPTEPGYLMAIIYGTSAALTSLILMSLLICYRQKLLAAFPVHFCCRGLNGRVEEETSVIYSSIVFRRSAETTNYHMTNMNSCVYSKIKVKTESSCSMNANDSSRVFHEKKVFVTSPTRF